MREGQLWESFSKLTEKHQILRNKKFFPPAINGRYKNYEEYQGQLLRIKLQTFIKPPEKQYEKLVNNAIKTSYKKVSKKTRDQINNQRKNILNNKEGINSMFINGKQSYNSFITLKDYKLNFQNNPTVRILHLAKNEVGKISKAILDKINVNLRNLLQDNKHQCKK